MARGHIRKGMRMGRSPLGFHGKRVSKKDWVSREPGDANCKQTEGYLSLKQKKRKLSHCEGLELSYETALLRFRVEERHDLRSSLSKG